MLCFTSDEEQKRGEENYGLIFKNKSLTTQGSCEQNVIEELEHSVGVLIKPEELLFENPLQGQIYEEKFCITNVGKNSIHIRIDKSPTVFCLHFFNFATALAPTFIKDRQLDILGYNKVLDYEHFEHVKMLAPGLSIKHAVKYIPTSVEIHHPTFIPIYINNILIRYRVNVKMDVYKCNIYPRLLNFGRMNPGWSGITRNVTIENTGTKLVFFAVDLGTGKTDLIVNPKKGRIEKNSSTTLTVKLSTFIVGTYRGEFWIITENPIHIKVTAEIIPNIIEPVLGFTAEDFVVIRFPVTYYGLSSNKLFEVRNLSQKPTLFSILAEINQEKIDLEDAKDVEPAFEQFQIKSFGTRMPPDKVSLFGFTFAPKVLKNYNDGTNRFLVGICIEKLHFKDTSPNSFEVHQDSLISKSISYTEAQKAIEKQVRDVTKTLSQHVEYIFDLDEEIPIIKPYETCEIRVLLCGEADYPSISLIPDQINLDVMNLSEKIFRVVKLKNESKKLPITFRYKKVVSIEVNPKMGHLKPQESIEISISVLPKSYDPVPNGIEFELLHNDYPNIFKTLKVIGSVKLGLRLKKKTVTTEFVPLTARNFDFKKPNIKPSREVYKMLIEEDALLALPDDRPAGLLPWKSKKLYRTIYSGMPRPLVVNDETKFKLMLENKKYYNNYIKKKRNVYSDDLVPPKVEVPNIDCEFKIPTQEVAHISALLTSAQLHNISISPKYWSITNVVVQSYFEKVISITNNNKFPIRIYLKPRNPELFIFPDGNRTVLQGMCCSFFKYFFMTNKVGISHQCIDVIINESYTFETSFSIKVSKKVLTLNTNHITFNSNGPYEQYVLLTNPFNAEINFEWDLFGDLILEPKSGVVPQQRSLYCVVSFDPLLSLGQAYELSLGVDDNTIYFSILVTVNRKIPQIILSENIIDFGKVAIAETKKHILRMKNNSPYAFNFSINKNIPTPLLVSPRESIVKPKSIFDIVIKFCSEDIGKFQFKFPIIIDSDCKLFVEILAIVSYPQIEFSPHILGGKKIESSSFDVVSFVIKNIGEVTAFVQFDTDKYLELKYSEIDDYMEERMLSKENVIDIPPGERWKFRIYFYPLYPTLMNYPIPIIFNNSRDIFNFTKKALRLKGIAFSPKINIKTWDYNFKLNVQGNNSTFALNPPKKVVMSTENSTKLYISLTGLTAFSFEHISGGNVSISSNKIFIYLDKGEEIIFQITFLPPTFGKFINKIPVYIKTDMEDQFHNNFTLTGEYIEPEITFFSHVIHIGFIPLNTIINVDVCIQLLNHANNCMLHVLAEDCNVFTSPSVHYTTDMEDVFMLTLEFSSPEFYVIDTLIQFECTCGKKKNIKCTGAAVNSFLTNYYFTLANSKVTSRMFEEVSVRNVSKSTISMKSRTIIDSEIVYPLYPAERSEYFADAELITAAIENWLYEQCCSFRAYYTIPDSISVYTLEEIMEAPSGKPVYYKIINAPYFRILNNICGPEIQKSIVTKYRTEMSQYVIACSFYRDILEFLRKMGALLPNIEPEFFIQYTDYCAYMTAINEKEAILSSDLFFRLSKQSWVDLILQTIKVLVCNKILLTNTENLKQETGSKKFSIRQHPNTTISIFSQEEMIVLNWMNKCLKNLKSNLGRHLQIYDTRSVILCDEKHISNFWDDLSDGVAFLAITLTYCPYLNKQLQSFYLIPSSMEEHVHNACLLIQTWKMLNINFSISYKDIVYPNPIKLILFSFYLFDLLPNFFPSKELKIVAELGNAETLKIPISNDTPADLHYTVIFFENNDKCFSSLENSVTIPPNAKRKFFITFEARFAKEINAIVLFNGENRGEKSVDSKAYNLVGIPKFLEPSSVVYLNTPLYKSKKFSLALEAPYKCKAEYEIYFGYGSDTSNLKNFSKIPDSFDYLFTRVSLKTHHIKVRANGKFRIDITTYAMTNFNGDILFFARNSKLGDFFIKLIINTNDHHITQNIFYNIPDYFMKSYCTCKKMNEFKFGCPKVITVSINSLNRALWQIIFLNINNMEIDNKAFWRCVNDDPFIFEVQKRIIKERFKPLTINKAAFQSDVTYNVFVTPACVLGPKTLRIKNNLVADGMTEIKFHIGSPLSVFFLKLVSMDDTEIRYYKIKLNKTC